MKYWVIEHETRGVYVGHDVYGESDAWRPRFAYSIAYSDERAEKVYSADAATLLLHKVQRDVRDPQKLRVKEMQTRY
jgi:hypothetical protein